MSLLQFFRDATDAEKKAHAEKWGGHHNEPPPGLTEITEAEFAKSNFFVYSPIARDFRQCRIGDEPKAPLTNLYTWFMHDGSGFAMAYDYWGGKVRYFRCGCKHDYRPLTPEELSARGIVLRMHDNAVICKNCGHLWQYDSSG